MQIHGGGITDLLNEDLEPKHYIYCHWKTMLLARLWTVA